MLTLRYPELLLLAVPVAWAFWRWGRLRGVTGAVRAVVAALLIFALSGPELRTGGRGMDVIVVADRSRSMTSTAAANLRELIANLDRNRGAGDRVGIVTFGAGAQVERNLSADGTLGEFLKVVSPDGSDLGEGLERALGLIERDRPARVLVLSDGEANGISPATAARHARELGVPVDVRSFARPTLGDTAIEAVLMPETVAPREPFQFSAVLTADGDTAGTVVVSREGREIARRDVNLLSGRNRVVFRDVLEQPGFVEYDVRLQVPGDPLDENNTGTGAVRIDAGPRLLVLNADGAADNLVRALRNANIAVDVAAAATHPVTQDALDPYRAVVMENVPAEEFGRLKMERLAQFVEDLGGGLLLTGGRRSFGVGGYFNSPLDPVLPVSMELREEHRKNRVAIAIALDRSGSMMATVTGGKTKMDLANLGTAEAVKLLSPGDKVAVIAVDSTPHVIQPLVDVTDTAAIVSKVRSIQSEGGGIFVYEALVAAGQELAAASDYATRHIILFSDAADSEEPGDYKKLLAQFETAGITTSVIGLGNTGDSDAKLLEDIASRGKGNIMFTEDAEELPRLFTQDTMSVARNTFLDNGPLPGELVPDARLMGELAAGRLPDVGGYNLSYLKPQATLAAVSLDEYSAPWSAFWYRGLGRAAAVTFEADGPFTGAIGKWAGYDDFFVTHARWLLSGEQPGAVFLTAERDGLDAVVTVELDPDRSEASALPTLVVVPPGDGRAPAVTPDLVWTGPDTLTARFRLDRTGSFRTLVTTPKPNGQADFTRGPAVTLPYSPEFMPRLGLPTGDAVLGEVATLSGGVARTDVTRMFADPPPSARRTPLLPWLALASVLLVVVEIAGRRLSLWERLVPVRDESPTPLPVGIPQAKRRWLELPKPARREPQAVRPPMRAPEAPKPAVPPQGPTLADVLARAKQRPKH